MQYLDVTTGMTFGLLAAALALWLVLRFGNAPNKVLTGSDNSLSILFEEETIVDVSDEAEALLRESSSTWDWPGIAKLFQRRFKICEQDFIAPEKDGVRFFKARDISDESTLTVRRTGSSVRVNLTGSDGLSGAESQKIFILKEKMKILQAANLVAPYPIWRLDSNEHVTWQNPAYESLYLETHKTRADPDKPLFQLPNRLLDPGKSRRIPLTPAQSRQTVWYDVQRLETPAGDFYSAVDANAIVRAEAAQRNFVQTLAKTFAHLPIGLAIFDDNRQLVLFNPAVIDLTGLGADFLSARPNLLGFFDELRNRRLMPEPKNYNSWRQQIADLVAAAADGRYSETWTLDSGRTYRVNGRPHPDGAIAFLIEDISSEVSLTRRFRAELELSQSVLDSFDTAISVFSPVGVLTVSNTSYRELWGVDPDSTFAEVTIIDCLRDWQHRAKPSPVWSDLRDYVLEFGDRASWSADVAMQDGRMLTLDASPLASGATMIRFSPLDGRPPVEMPAKHRSETTNTT